jgi:hypothetical protein
MPWKRAKALPPPDNTLFEACFRIQREAMRGGWPAYPARRRERARGSEMGRAGAVELRLVLLWGDVPALMPIRANSEGVKCGGDWFNASQPSISRTTSSRSPQRRAAVALISKIPLPLSRHIARAWLPRQEAA